MMNRKETGLITYVVLFRWTDQGIRNVKETVSRLAQARALVERSGGKLVANYWTQGQYDMVSAVEWPDDETAAAFMLSLSSMGNLRGETMRAFNESEMERIIAKMP